MTTTVPPFKVPIGPLEITGYGLMVMVGFLVGGWLIDRELRRRKLNPDYAADIVVAAVIGGIVGAKIWYAGLHGIDTLLNRAGMVWYGGFLGGTLAVIVSGIWKGVPTRWTAELVAPALAAAYALGRIGCFMVGDDYGVPTDLPWAVAFPQGLPPTTAQGLASLGWMAPEGTPPTEVFGVHPTQLYETLLMTAAFMVLWRLRKKGWGTGWLMGMYLVFAGAERFLVEFLRVKDDRFFGSFTLAQVTSVAIMLVGLWIVTALRRLPEAAPGKYLTTT